MKLTFHGGAGSVTGSNYLLETATTRILVDCGLNQGSHFAERENFEPFPYDPSSIQALLITHAHVDHTGRIPKLYKDGFRGSIYSTPPTRDFSELLLMDSEHILNIEAEREHEAPLYGIADLEEAMKLWKEAKYHEPVTVGDMRITFYNAGHVLGSATILVEAEGKRVVFSGDLGNYPAPIIQPTESLPEADYVLLESTYGDRVHENAERREEDLEDVIEDVVRGKGVLLIPAFALERTQELLYHLNQLFEQKRIPRVPVFLDSPLAIKVTTVYKKYESYFNAETARIAATGDDILNFPELNISLTTEQSKAINHAATPKIIIAGSGMSQGGRILHHERLYLGDPRTTILFIGYQSQGSLGRRILEGEQRVRIFGEEVEVRAKVRSLPAYSAHADQPRLLAWVEPMRNRIKKMFIVQGEGEASKVLATKLRDGFAIDAVIPERGTSVVL